MATVTHATLYTFASDVARSCKTTVYYTWLIRGVFLWFNFLRTSQGVYCMGLNDTSSSKQHDIKKNYFVNTITRSPACIVSHYCHGHKTSHHEVVLSDGISIAGILE